MTVTTGRDAFAQSRPPGLVAMVRSKRLVPRAAIIALAIGSALAAINQTEAVTGAAAFDIASLALGYLAPFVVVVISQVLGIRAGFREAAVARPAAIGDEPFLRTALSHGIPVRAVAVALTAGTILTAIMAGLTVAAGGDPYQLPLDQVGQVYALPLVFGLISQSVAYRRAKGGDQRFSQKHVTTPTRQRRKS